MDLDFSKLLALGKDQTVPAGFTPVDGEAPFDDDPLLQIIRADENNTAGLNFSGPVAAAKPDIEVRQIFEIGEAAFFKEAFKAGKAKLLEPVSYSKYGFKMVLHFTIEQAAIDADDRLQLWMSANYKQPNDPQNILDVALYMGRPETKDLSFDVNRL